MAEYKVELTLLIEADSSEAALDEVRAREWTWTVTDEDGNVSYIENWYGSYRRHE